MLTAEAARNCLTLKKRFRTMLDDAVQPASRGKGSSGHLLPDGKSLRFSLSPPVLRPRYPGSNGIDRRGSATVVMLTGFFTGRRPHASIGKDAVNDSARRVKRAMRSASRSCANSARCLGR